MYDSFSSGVVFPGRTTLLILGAIVVSVLARLV